MTALYEFAQHEGFDGLMVGHPQAPYHFEFARQAGHVVAPAPTAEQLLIFCQPERVAREAGSQSVLGPSGADFCRPRWLPRSVAARGLGFVNKRNCQSISPEKWLTSYVP